MKKILIVDDEMFNRILLEDILSGITEDFEIITASSGKEALGMIINEKPVLVFMDILLPDITGLDIIERVRSKEEVSNTKFIITTGCAPYNLKSGIEGFADVVLYKPFQQKKVLQAFTNLLGSSFN